jgi:TetR/AcrR family transcriptional regulator
MSAFSRRGFKAATTKEIAAAAGVTEAVIFQHFPSKEALYSAVLELHLETADEERWIEEVNDCMEQNDDEGVFLSFIRRILLSYRCDPMIERVILFAALEGHEQGLARMQKQFAPVFERFMEYIARRQREGALADCNPYAIMIALGGIAHQYGLITQIFRAPAPDISDEEMANQFTRILLNGIQAAPSVKENDRKIQKPAEQSNRKANK